MRPRARIDWHCATVWTGIAIFAITIWTLALIGAVTVLDWIR